MKNFQQNLFITLAVALCGLCAWQWYFQTVQRDRIESLGQMVYKQASQIQGYTNSIASMDAEVSGHEARIDELKQTVKTNELEILSEKREVLRLKLSSEAMSNEIAQYQSLTNFLTGKLQEAYDGVKKQNEAVAKLVAERDEFVSKYNDSVKARNEVVEKYNDLVQQVKKIEDAQKASVGK
jgi:chromosome segregation ATPase